MCAAPSPERIVSWTARNAGEVTVGGTSEPPGRIVNVAGTRTFADPPAGADGCVEPADADEVWVVLVETLAGGWALVEALVLVEPLGLAEPLAVAAPPAPVAALAALVLGDWVALEPALCPDPPQPASHTATTANPEKAKPDLIG